MGLQEVYYILGIFYMSMGIVLLIALVFAVFYIKRKIDNIQKSMEEKLDIIAQAAKHPGEAAVGIGASLAEAAIEKIKGVLEKKEKKKSS
jgi:hypothetical protein